MVPMMTMDFNAYRDLIQHLCVEAGRIMEDESPELALNLPASQSAIATRLEAMSQAGSDIAALAAAAEVLLRRSTSGP